MDDIGSPPNSARSSMHSRMRALHWRTEVFQETVLKSLAEIREAMQYVHHGVRAEHVQRQRHASFRRGTGPPPRGPTDVPRQNEAEPHYVPTEPVPETVFSKFDPPKFVLLRRPEGVRERSVDADAEASDPFVKVELPEPTDTPTMNELAIARKIRAKMGEDASALLTRRVETALIRKDEADKELALKQRLAEIEARQLDMVKLADEAQARELELRQRQMANVNSQLAIEERTRIVTRRAERSVEIQVRSEMIGMQLSNHAAQAELVAQFLELSGLTIERVSRLGVDATAIARVLVLPATSSADVALQMVQACTAMPKWAGRVVSAIGAAGLLGVAIPIPPIAAAAGVTSATFLIAGLALNVGCYIVESPFHGLSMAGRLTMGGINLAGSMAEVVSAAGTVMAMPSHSSSRVVRTGANVLSFGGRMAMRVARSTTLTATLVDSVEESITTRTVRLVSAVIAPTISHAETSLALMRARLEADAAAIPRETAATAEVALSRASARSPQFEQAQARSELSTHQAGGLHDPSLTADLAVRARREAIMREMTENQFEEEMRVTVDVAGIANSLVQDPDMLREFEELLGDQE